MVYLPLWKIWKSVGIIIPNIWKNKTCSKPPTSYQLPIINNWQNKPRFHQPYLSCFLDGWSKTSPKPAALRSWQRQIEVGQLKLFSISLGGFHVIHIYIYAYIYIYIYIMYNFSIYCSYILYIYTLYIIWAIVKTLGSRKRHPQIWEGPIAYHTFVQ